ncbi:hypothetical protein [Cupriavidus necator]
MIHAKRLTAELDGAGTYENIHVNMPAFGLGKVGNLIEAVGGRQSARHRMAAIAAEDAGPRPNA